MTMDADLQNRVRGQLKRLLHEGVVTVEFTKKDGSLREMRCTLNEDLIDDALLPSGAGVPDNKEVLRVFDLDIEEWRSFRLDRLIQFTIYIEDQPDA